MPNHLHLPLRTGRVPFSMEVQRILAGNVVTLDHRLRRPLQTRYKSTLGQEEPYLLELVRFIHRTPYGAR